MSIKKKLAKFDWLAWLKYPGTALSYLKDIFTGKYKEYSKGKLFLLIAMLLYLLSPIDLFPDFLLGGLVDDAVIITWAMNAVKEELEQYKKKKESKPDA